MPYFEDNELKNRMFDSSPMPIVVMDAGTYAYIDCNPAAIAIYGFPSKETAIGKTPFDVSAPFQYDNSPSREKAIHYINEGKQKGTVVFEWRHQRPDGEIWDAEVHLFCFTVGDRELIQFSLIDISARRQTERIQRILHDLILDLNSCSNLYEGLSRVLGSVLQLEPLDCGGVYIADLLDGSLNIAASSGLSDEFVLHASHFPADDPNALLARKGRNIYGVYSEITSSIDPVKQREGLRAFAMIPVMDKERLIAVLNLGSHTHDAIPLSSRTILETVAYQIGGTLLRLRSDEALRQSEEVLSAFLNSASDGFCIFDSNLKFVAINRRGQEIFGITRDEAIGKETAGMLSGVVGPGTTEQFLEVLRTGNSYVAEYTIRHERLGTSYYLLTAFRVRDGLGLIAHDITQRKCAEEALRDNEEIFSLFMQHTPILAYIKEILEDESRVLQASDNFLDLIGRSGSDIRGRLMKDLFPPEFAAKMIADDLAVVKENKVLSIFEEFNGRYYTTIKFPIVQEKRTLLAGYTIDITEQKKAEASLEKEKLFVEKLLNSLPVIFYLYDGDLKLRRWNKKCVDLLGYSDDELNGVSVETFLRSEDIIELARKGISEVVQNNAYVETEADLYSKDNSMIHFLLTASRFDTDEGPMLMGVGLDITDRRRAEEHNEKLLERLNQVQKLESLGVLAGGIAHDFNNLLGGIFGYIDLARLENSPEERENCLVKAVSAIDRTRALTHQLLTFAKGGAPVKRVESFLPFVQDTVQFALSGTSISSRFDIEQDLWPGEFDKNQVGQVIDNIVINALQAMPNGGTLDVAIKNFEFRNGEHPPLEAGKYVGIKIADQGIGIPREYLARIFDPFYTTKPKGHGLGLSTCFSIVNRHDGCIDVDSEPGKGTVFEIYLPAYTETQKSSSSNQPGQHRGSGLFLVMDDEEIMRETMGYMLHSFGYTVIFAKNGEEAVSRFSAESVTRSKIAGMIFDLTVKGGMGGREAIVQIRKLSADVPVFVSSGYGDDPVMATPAEYGFTASIRKPFMRAEFAELLNTYIGSRG